MVLFFTRLLYVPNILILRNTVDYKNKIKKSILMREKNTHIPTSNYRILNSHTFIRKIIQNFSQSDECFQSIQAIQ